MLRMTLALLVLLPCSTFLIGAASATTFTKPKYYKSCAYIFNAFYLKGPSHKAFAVNNPPGRSKLTGSTICWSTTTMPSKSEAIAHALKKCRSEVVRRGGSGKCRIYAAE